MALNDKIETLHLLPLFVVLSLNTSVLSIQFCRSAARKPSWDVQSLQGSHSSLLSFLVTRYWNKCDRSNGDLQGELFPVQAIAGDSTIEKVEEAGKEKESEEAISSSSRCCCSVTLKCKKFLPLPLTPKLVREEKKKKFQNSLKRLSVLRIDDNKLIQAQVQSRTKLLPGATWTVSTCRASSPTQSFSLRVFVPSRREGETIEPSSCQIRVALAFIWVLRCQSKGLFS